MTFRGDAYRVLGVPPDASTVDVKRAYRRLAKRHHPDAGEGSVARFLEVQAAYEVLMRADGSGGPGHGASRTAGRRPAQQSPRNAGSRRASGETPGDQKPPPPPGTEWARRPRERGTRPTTSTDAATGSGAAGERGRRARDPRKATLGSTTYDEAGEAADPTWDGAEWYGPASGTYWTVNPKEYADPRKHGPEYTARWAARHGGTGAPTMAPPAAAGRPADTAAPPTQAPAAGVPSRQATGSRVAPASTPRTSTGVGHPAWPRPRERFIIGALGWLPFGALLAAAVGLPGGLIATLPLQVVGLIGMLRAPRVAWASAGGLAAVVAFAIPGVAVVAALGVVVQPGGPAPVGLIVLAALAWCGGVGVASSGRLIVPPWRVGA